MHKQVILLLVVSLVLASGCLDGGSNISQPSTVSTLEEPTTVNAASTTLSEDDEDETPTTLDAPVYAKCESFSPLQRELCYLGIAITTGNVSLCGAINADFRKQFCLETINVTVNETSTIISGQIVNKNTGKGYYGSLVEVFDVSNMSVPVNWDKTDRNGYYKATVKSGGTYDIIVNVEGTRLKQTKADLASGKLYVVDFIIS
ncbi:MAG: hypothetical protein V1921_05610 [Candidatus Altiarchaeota archaeon]